MDRCTLWLDGWPTWLGGTGDEWRHCCLDHDVAGNSWTSNLELAVCVGQESPIMATIMFAGLSTVGWLYVWARRKRRKGTLDGH